jgi:enoyl-CoA hydratase/carnithine racemase
VASLINLAQPRHVRLEVRERVATITLSEHPERKNPLTFESYAELRDLFLALADVDDVRAVVLTGAGEDFCSGGDVHDIIGPLVRMDFPGKLRFTRMTGELLKAMRHCPQPIVAAVDGVCAGAGAILAMGSDLRLGTPRVRVSFLFVRVGLSGADMGACAILPRIVGQGRAAELLYTGRTMAADEAERWGFLNRLVEPLSLHAEAQALAASIAGGPTFAHAMTKRMLHHEWDLSVDAAIEAEAHAQAMCMETNDFRRAYEAFSATPRQRPAFQGD